MLEINVIKKNFGETLESWYNGKIQNPKFQWGTWILNWEKMLFVFSQQI